ncbi:MAG: DUF480 domain-containing protein [Actinomycetia bacterium]|nr:DUF480 domain-containing protein [Actinomycetes bacterium]
MDLPTLDAREQRVLGALLEKQVTVPDSYPMTAASLRTACNQASSREPVVAYTESEVNECLRGLKARSLVRYVVLRGARTVKLHQLLAEQLGLEPEQRAVLTVLLLRGPQTPGQLKTRTERLHAFADRQAVEQTLAAMAEREPPLVRQLPLRPREQDRRWVHLLGPVGTGVAEVADPVDREQVLSQGAEARDRAVLQAYEIVAASGPVQPVPAFDVWLLGRLAEQVSGPVADVGTGSGQVAGLLADRGVEVVGSDVSEGMVAEARLRFPQARFEVADLRRLLRPRAAAGWSAVTGWYALAHLAESELPAAIGHLGSVLVPGGWLALALYAGPATRHLTELAGHAVELDLVAHDPEVVRAAVTGAGLEVVEWYLRGPEGDETWPSQYLLARRHP